MRRTDVVKSVSVYAKKRNAAIVKAKRRSHLSSKKWRVSDTHKFKGSITRHGMNVWEVTFRRRGAPHFG